MKVILIKKYRTNKIKNKIYKRLTEKHITARQPNIRIQPHWRCNYNYNRFQKRAAL